MNSDTRARPPAAPGLACALALIGAFGILTIWIPAAWPGKLAECAVLLLAGAWAIRTAARNTRLRADPMLAVLAGAAVWPLVQLASGTTVIRYATGNATVEWLARLALFWLALQAFARRDARVGFLRAWAWFAVGLSVVAVAQYYTSAGKVFWMFESGYPDALVPFLNRNNFASFLLLPLPFALWEGLRGGRGSSSWLLAAVAILGAVVAGVSRAGTALAVGEFLAVFLLARLRLPAASRLGRSALLVVFAAALAFPVFGWQALWDRLQAEQPFPCRPELLRSTLSMARDRPAAGFGLGTFSSVYPAYALFDRGSFVNYAHNDWAQWAAEGGLPFLALAACLAVMAFRPAIASVWGIGILAVFAHGLVDFPMQKPALMNVLMLFLGALAAWRQDQPLTTPMGRNLATLRARPARSITSMTSSTSL